MSNKTQRLVLSDIWPKPQAQTQTIIRNATLVVGFVLLTAICAQIRVPLGFTPVPVTGQTFAVLHAGAVLGKKTLPRVAPFLIRDLIKMLLAATSTATVCV